MAQDKAQALLPTQKLALELKQSASHSAPAPLGTTNGGQLANASALAPKKPNEDLKRELQPSLDELAIQTQEAIATLVQRKMAEQAAAEKPSDRSQPASGSGEPQDSDEKTTMDGAALARMVEMQADQQGLHMT